MPADEYTEITSLAIRKLLTAEPKGLRDVDGRDQAGLREIAGTTGGNGSYQVEGGGDQPTANPNLNSPPPDESASNVIRDVIIAFNGTFKYCDLRGVIKGNVP